MPQADSSAPHLKVLVVDDQLDAAESLAFSLQFDGRTVQYATSGEEALKLAETFAPDFALIDVFMPRVDGHQLARALRERFGAEMVIVAVTGALKSVELGDFDFHLTKPIDFTQLHLLLAHKRGDGC